MRSTTVCIRVLSDQRSVLLPMKISEYSIHPFQSQKDSNVSSRGEAKRFGDDTAARSPAALCAARCIGDPNSGPVIFGDVEILI